MKLFVREIGGEVAKARGRGIGGKEGEGDTGRKEKAGHGIVLINPAIIVNRGYQIDNKQSGAEEIAWVTEASYGIW